MIPNPLTQVWKNYQISTECFKVAQEAIRQQQFHLFASSDWPIQPNAMQDITASVREVQELFVFSLWATFERFVITYLQHKGAALQTVVPRELAHPLYEIFQKEVEYWNQKEVLDLLQHLSVLDKNSIGRAKQILDYRNWVAHGKDSRKKSVVKTMTPIYTYQTLNEIVKVLILN